MDSGTILAVGASSFLVTHVVMSHFLREQLIGALGAMGYQITYSVISLATLGLAIWGYRGVPPTQPLWDTPYWTSVLCAFLMFGASVLFVGSVSKNPAMPLPDADEAAMAAPHGVFKITRHPMMWAFAIWGAAHIIAKPTAANLWLMGSIAALAIIGSLSQDSRKAEEMGASWQQWQARTSFIPFGNGLATPGSGIIIAGIALWMAASWAHHGLGYAMVPPWVNLWA